MDFIVGIISRNLATTSNFETVGIFTFFEAPSIRCRKKTCDVTKVTHYMYSCDTCCKIREMMETDGGDVPSVKIVERRDISGIFEFLMNKTKTCIVSSSPKAKKRATKGKKDAVAWRFDF